MIGILYHTRDQYKIFAYLKASGIAESEFEIYKPGKKYNCLIRFGGSGVRSDHCYVKHYKGIPEVQVLDPGTTIKEPFNHYWICLGIEKAIDIAKNGYKAPDIDLIIRPTLADIKKHLELAAKTTSAFDIESDVDTKNITAVGVAYRYKDGTPVSISIPLVERRNGNAVSVWMPKDEALVWEMIDKYLNCPSEKVMQNYIFDTMMMSRQGINTNGIIHDTMILQHLIGAEFKYHKALSLENIGRIHLAIPPWKNVKSYISTESLWKYNARDSAYTLLIFEKQKEIINENPTKKALYENILRRLPTEVLRMCERGWTIDYDFIDMATRSLEAKTGRLRSDLASIADDLVPPKISYTYRRGPKKAGATYCVGVGEPTSIKYKKNAKDEETIEKISFAEYSEIDAGDIAEVKQLKDSPIPIFEKKVEERVFNPGSSQQVKEVFYGLGIKLPTKTDNKTGEVKERVGKNELLWLQDRNPDCEFINFMIDFRKLEKILTTYCRFKPDPDGKARFKITIPGTVGSRFSSAMTDWDTGFNSQNLPKIKIEGRSFRCLSIPSQDDMVILNMDFKQADPHMVAWMSGCQSMLDVLDDPKGDLHSHTASSIFGYDITKKEGFNKDTNRERKLGKIANNALNYNMQWKTFKGNARKSGLKLTDKEAQMACEGYHASYSEIKDNWYHEVEAAIRMGRPIETPFGRTRLFFFHGKTEWEINKVLSEALSYVPQTHVTDCINLGNLYFLDMCREAGIEINWLQNCHDSNKWEVRKKDLETACKLMQIAYNKVVFKINGIERCFKIDIEYGPNWGDMQEWKG